MSVLCLATLDGAAAVSDVVCIDALFFLAGALLQILSQIECADAARRDPFSCVVRRVDRPRWRRDAMAPVQRSATGVETETNQDEGYRHLNADMDPGNRCKHCSIHAIPKNSDSRH